MSTKMPKRILWMFDVDGYIEIVNAPSQSAAWKEIRKIHLRGKKRLMGGVEETRYITN